MNALSGSIHHAINQAQHQSQAEGEEAPADKSIYQTFIDVSSIFSKSFGDKKQTNKSRFVQEISEEDEAEEQSPGLFRMPSHTEAEASIFSSSNLFGNQ
jgi:hypothetical protein